MPNPWVRSIAAASAVSGVLGALGVSVAVATLPHPWYSGYISEAGVASSPRVGIYRAGVVGIALSLALLGLVTRRMLPLTAGLLGVAAAFAGLSATVSCSPGCPLPPYEHPTLMDWLHAIGAVTAVGLAALALLATAWKATDRGLRRSSLAWFGVAAPPSLGLAVALLAIGRSDTTAVLERVSLTLTLAGVVALAIGVARDPAELRADPVPAEPVAALATEGESVG